MPYGQTTGVRALVDHALTSAEAQGGQQRFVAETVGDGKGAGLLLVLKALDEKYARSRNATYQQEYIAAYALARDFRYARRSRRWLLGRVVQNRFDRACNTWTSFLRENLTLDPSLEKLVARDINELVNEDFSKTLKL